VAYNAADDTATLVNTSGKAVRNFSYEEIIRLIGKSGTTRELNNFVSMPLSFLPLFFSVLIYIDGYSDYFMLGNQRLLGIAHKRLQPVEGKS